MLVEHIQSSKTDKFIGKQYELIEQREKQATKIGPTPPRVHSAENLESSLNTLRLDIKSMTTNVNKIVLP